MGGPLGVNRTGLGMSPFDAARTVRAAADPTFPSPHAATALLTAVRETYGREADPIGSLPPPTTLRGMAQAAVNIVRGRNATVLVDRLGQRLAFERTGVRLYEGLLATLETYGSWDDGPTASALQQIHDDELSHLTTLRDALIGLGADPTAQTPAADVIGVACSGLLTVVADPRTSLAQSLEAVLLAELADNDGWDLLVQVATTFDQHAMVDAFVEAQAQEAEHLRQVRAWLHGYTWRDANLELPSP
jgi:hypothetical protein